MEKQNNADKLSDKAFSRWMLTSVLGIFVCIICLCSTTYAWFTDSLPSTGNEIVMADECLLSVFVYQDGSELSGIQDGVELEAGTVYTVTLSLPPDTASGYCLITAGGHTYYSDYIARHQDSAAQTVSFTLTVESTQTVVFTPRWGIYNRQSDVVDATLIIP